MNLGNLMAVSVIPWLLDLFEATMNQNVYLQPLTATVPPSPKTTVFQCNSVFFT